MELIEKVDHPGQLDTAAPARLVDQLAGVVLGNPTALRIAVAAFLAGGHVLFEDSPGVGKTVLAKAMALSIGGTSGRVQGTPDLLPSDLTGVSIYHEDTREWAFTPGPLFHHVVVVDELNRATPRSQSALLEAMAERTVSVDGTTHSLPDPFLVIATQNPHGDVGTFPLVAGQRDRLAVSLSLGLPGREVERRLVTGSGGDRELSHLVPVAPLPTWIALRSALETEVVLHDVVVDYALDLIDVVRSRAGGDSPVSTRAAMVLLAVARGHAAVEGRSYVAPDDVQAIAVAVLAHRVIDVVAGHLPSARQFVEQIVRTLPVPPRPAGVSR